MMRKLTLQIGILLITTTFTVAQDEYKFEITPHIGYSFSEGVNINPTNVGGGQIVDQINPKSGFTYGFLFDFLAAENLALGFNFTEQSSKLEGRIQGGSKVDYTDMKVRNYHGLITYNAGDEDSPMRPYFFGGLGATLLHRCKPNLI